MAGLNDIAAPRRVLGALACVGAVVLADTAQAGYYSSFDSFANGQQLSANGGWQGWDNVASAAGIVDSSLSFSGAHSMRVGDIYTDAVQQFSGVTSGVWTFATQQYIASGQTGSTYVILMNQYADGANNASDMWSSQLNFDLSAGIVRDDFRGGSVAIAFDQWSTVSISIDLASNIVSQYYNGSLIASGSWTTGATSALRVAALDLYTGGGNTAFYDNVALSNAAAIPAPGVLSLASLGLLLAGARQRR